MFYHPCAFTSASGSFFFFQANTFAFPCSPLKRCTAGTRHRRSYSYHSAGDKISRPTSRSGSCRPFFFFLPNKCSLKKFCQTHIKKKKIFTEKTTCCQAEYALFLSYLLWVTQAICTAPCARKELFVHVSLPFFQVLNFELNLSIPITPPCENVMVSLSCTSLKVGASPPSKDLFVADGFLLIFKPLWRALCVWQR